MMEGSDPRTGHACRADEDPRRALWNHFILARALGRGGRLAAARAGESPIPYCFVDTHAGCGRISRPSVLLKRMFERRQDFVSADYFHGLRDDELDTHPGSWLLAGRVLDAVAGDSLVVEMDVNDINKSLVPIARGHREGTWVRFWSHDWFQFLRSRLSLAAPPQFVFIDPPADDPRGSAYAIDAAIMLDTMKIPFLISYPAADAQEPINEIGRTGLELVAEDIGTGVLLGGGAEGVLLDVLPDLRLLAQLLGGELNVRLPYNDDYCI